MNLVLDSTVVSFIPDHEKMNVKEIVSQVNNCLISKNQVEAAKILESACALYPGFSEFPMKLGHLLYSSKEYAKAAEFYNKSLEIASADQKSQIFFGLGQAYYEEKLYSKSFSAFSMLTDSYPDFKFNYIAYLKMAEICKFLKDYNESISILTKLLNFYSKDKKVMVHIFCQIGSCYELMGNIKNAHCFIRTAWKTLKNFRTVSCMAWIYLKSNPKKAEKICQQFLSSKRPDCEWHDINFLRALALFKLKNFGHSIEILEELVKAYPNNVYYLQYLGIAYFHIGSTFKSLKNFQKVSKIDFFSSENLHNLAVIYKKLGFKGELLHIL